MASVSLLEPLLPGEGLTASDKDAGSPYCRRSNVSGHVASLDASLLDGRKVGTPDRPSLEDNKGCLCS